MWLPVVGSWRLNERHYGALQGLNKAETAAKFGDEQVKIWRRSYDVPPPALDRRRRALPGPRPALRRPRRRRHPALRVAQGHGGPLPARSGTTTIAPSLRDGQRVLVAAHGNSLRALVKYLDGISDADIVGLNIPTGVPLVYDLDDDLRPLGRRYLGRRRARRRRRGRGRGPGERAAGLTPPVADGRGRPPRGGDPAPCATIPRGPPAGGSPAE